MLPGHRAHAAAQGQLGGHNRETQEGTEGEGSGEAASEGQKRAVTLAHAVRQRAAGSERCR